MNILEPINIYCINILYLGLYIYKYILYIKKIILHILLFYKLENQYETHNRAIKILISCLIVN